jgi:hypothetical protein
MHVGKSLVLLLLLGGCAACSSARAQVIEDKPTLVVPPVPPRSIEPVAAAEPLPAEPEPAPTPPPSAPPKAKSTAKNDVKPEPKPDAPPPETPATVPNPPPPVGPLRTAATPTGPEATRQVREIMARAEGVLSKVDYQKLTADRRATYDSAKRYISQAEEALKKEDVTLARSFADRAESIARQFEQR